MTGFTITITGANYHAMRRYPSAWCAADALRWAAMLRDGYTADTKEAKQAQEWADAERERLNRENAIRKAGK